MKVVAGIIVAIIVIGVILSAVSEVGGDALVLLALLSPLVWLVWKHPMEGLKFLAIPVIILIMIGIASLFSGDSSDDFERPGQFERMK